MRRGKMLWDPRHGTLLFSLPLFPEKSDRRESQGERRAVFHLMHIY